MKENITFYLKGNISEDSITILSNPTNTVEGFVRVDFDLVQKDEEGRSIVYKDQLVNCRFPVMVSTNPRNKGSYWVGAGKIEKREYPGNRVIVKDEESGEKVMRETVREVTFTNFKPSDQLTTVIIDAYTKFKASMVMAKASVDDSPVEEAVQMELLNAIDSIE